MVTIDGNVWDSGTLGNVKFTFEERDNFEGVHPVTQSWGLCFNDEGKLLIGRCR